MPERLELVATEDPTDMAHLVRDPERDRGEGLLLPARMVRDGQKRARVYPRAVMINPVVFDAVTGRPKRRRDGRGVLRRVIGEDSMHDALFEKQRDLEREHGGVSGLSARYSCTTIADARNAALQGRGARDGGRGIIDVNRAAFSVEPAEVTLARYRRGEWRAEE